MGKSNLMQFNNWNGLKICGKGTIDGQGFMWWMREYSGSNTHARSHLIGSRSVKNFELTGVLLKNSPMYHFISHNLENAWFHDFEVQVDIVG